MKRIIFVIAGVLVFTAQTFAQVNKKEKAPDEQITVNKKYDDQGNLIQYDSTYVHSWSSDSTIHFAFPHDHLLSGKGFPDIEEFLHKFMNDSSAVTQHGISPFDQNDFFNYFGESFPDSLLHNFSLKHDSVYFDFPMDSLKNLPQGFMPNFDELMQGLQNHLGNIHDPLFEFPPKFQSPEEQKEWQQLMEKHRKEMENFRKKWDQDNSDLHKL